MLADRATQLDAEEESSGHPSIWRNIYALFRCPGPPCNLCPYCWQDPSSKKRYKLRTPHLKALIGRVEQGRWVQAYDDVPDEIREQLVTERSKRHRHALHEVKCNVTYISNSLAIAVAVRPGLWLRVV
jgi:hypothetical protein